MPSNSSASVRFAELQEGREATFEERATWGTCPVCKAAPGYWCHADVGVQLGVPVGGGRMKDGEGVHLARLKNAPLSIKVVSCG